MTEQQWIKEDRGHETPCHIWIGARSGQYGWDSERRQTIHRTAWENTYGPIPGLMHIHHLCGVKMCVNVLHLELRSPAEHRRLHSNAKKPSSLDTDAVREIREGKDLLSVVAAKYGISKSYAAKVRRGMEPSEFRLRQPLPAWDRGHPKPPRQVGHLSDEQITYIRESDASLGILAEMFSMSRVYMSKVKRGLAPKP